MIFEKELSECFRSNQCGGILSLSSFSRIPTFRSGQFGLRNSVFTRFEVLFSLAFVHLIESVMRTRCTHFAEYSGVLRFMDLYVQRLLSAYEGDITDRDSFSEGTVRLAFFPNLVLTHASGNLPSRERTCNKRYFFLLVKNADVIVDLPPPSRIRRRQP